MWVYVVDVVVLFDFGGSVFVYCGYGYCERFVEMCLVNYWFLFLIFGWNIGFVVS